jgi:hypothetical protein
MSCRLIAHRTTGGAVVKVEQPSRKTLPDGPHMGEQSPKPFEGFSRKWWGRIRWVSTPKIESRCSRSDEGRPIFACQVGDMNCGIADFPSSQMCSPLSTRGGRTSSRIERPVLTAVAVAIVSVPSFAAPYKDAKGSSPDARLRPPRSRFAAAPSTASSPSAERRAPNLSNRYSC